MIIFLDNDHGRMKWFKSNCPRALCVSTANDVIAHLRRFAVDWVFLDHDLGPDKNAGNGMQVVDWIIKNQAKIKRVIIHSANFVDSLEMQHKLQAAGYDVQNIAFADINFAEVV